MSLSSSACKVVCKAVSLHKLCFARKLPRAAGIQDALLLIELICVSLYVFFNTAFLLMHQCFSVNNLQVKDH